MEVQAEVTQLFFFFFTTKDIKKEGRLYLKFSIPET